MKKILIIAFVFLSSNLICQVDPPPSPPTAPKVDVNTITVNSKDDSSILNNQIFDIVEVVPEFPGGDVALIKFLSDNIAYPELAKEEGHQGRVYIQFVVWKDGSVRDVNVVKGAHSSLDKEAIRVVNLMPKWKPGIQRGKPVNCRFTLPIKFKIDGGHSSGDLIDNERKAKEMLKEGHSVKNVSKKTNLSEKEVKVLKKEMK